jgi:hypothetical protein
MIEIDGFSFLEGESFSFSLGGVVVIMFVFMLLFNDLFLDLILPH